MGDNTDTHKRPSSTPQFGPGGAQRNDLKADHFSQVKNAAINRRRGFLIDDPSLLPDGGMQKIYSRTWRDAEGLRVHERHGRPVIYEYKNGKMVFKTTNPSKAKMAYMEGDIFLIQELRRRDVESIYPSLRRKSNDFSFLSLLLLFVGFEEPEYTIGHRIKKIDLFTKFVSTNAVIKLGGQWIPIKGKNSFRVYSEVKLNIRWNHYVVSSNIVRFGKLVEAVTINIASFGTAAIGRKIGKKIVSYVGKKVARRGFRKIFSEAFKTLLTTSLKCSKKFIIAFAKDLEAKNQVAEMHKSAGAFFDNRLIVHQSLVTTSSEFSNCLVETLFDNAATKHIPEFIEDLLGESAGMIKKKIAAAITTEIIKLPTTAFFTKMNTAIMKAAADSADGKKDFSELMLKYMLDEWKGHLSSMAKDWSSSIADSLVENL